jgi:hypothetical protein
MVMLDRNEWKVGKVNSHSEQWLCLLLENEGQGEGSEGLVLTSKWKVEGPCY